MKQRDRRLSPDAEDDLLAPEQSVLAIEHERAPQRAEQAADREHDDAADQRPERAEGDEPDADADETISGPRRRARQHQLDTAARPFANLDGAEPIEHDSAYQARCDLAGAASMLCA